MAIYHLRINCLGRAAGHSAPKAAAYRSGTRVRDHRIGQTFDYAGRRTVVFVEIVLPTTAADSVALDWARDREVLWNMAEQAEGRKDARVAREYEVALPAELTATDRQELARAFARLLADRLKVAVDLAIHAPADGADPRNHYAQLLTTTRRITALGLGDKSDIELSNDDRRARGMPASRAEIAEIRAQWAALCNEALARHGHDARVDHRTLAAQRADALAAGEHDLAAALDRPPTRHLGAVATAMERKGLPTAIGDFNRIVATQAEVALLAREKATIAEAMQSAAADLAVAARELQALRLRRVGPQE